MWEQESLRVPVGGPTFLKFMDEVRSIAVANRWRIGQALFNHLINVRPLLADSLRGSNIDPFFSDNTEDGRYKGAYQFIQERWDHPVDQEISQFG